MDTSQTFGPSPNIQGTFLDSKYVNPDYLFSHEVDVAQRVFHVAMDNRMEALATYQNVLFFLALFFLTIICYSAVRMFEIRKKEHAHLHHEMMEYAHMQKELEKNKTQGSSVSTNPRWVKTLEYLFSDHASDWKLAVIEADSMLEELITQLGFTGESLGDKLKKITEDKFRSLPSAWEVHTIRNRIAHEGVNFDLSQREAKRVIAIYEHIFRQYGFV